MERDNVRPHEFVEDLRRNLFELSAFEDTGTPAARQAVSHMLANSVRVGLAASSRWQMSMQTWGMATSSLGCSCMSAVPVGLTLVCHVHEVFARLPRLAKSPARRIGIAR